MTDDLKERLRDGVPVTKQILHEGMTFDLGGVQALQLEALAYITDLEARLAAAVEVQDRLMRERYQQYLRAQEAEAGEDALAEALRITRERLMDAVHSEFDGVWSAEDFNDQEAEAVSALAAYEARRKG